MSPVWNQPSVNDGLVRVGPAPVAAVHHRRALDPDLAALPRRRVAPVVVDDAQLDRRRGAADRAGMREVVVAAVRGRDRRGLGEAVRGRRASCAGSGTPARCARRARARPARRRSDARCTDDRSYFSRFGDSRMRHMIVGTPPIDVTCSRSMICHRDVGIEAADRHQHDLGAGRVVDHHRRQATGHVEQRHDEQRRRLDARASASGGGVPAHRRPRRRAR